VLALGAINMVGVILFAALYATAGARLMPQEAFLACVALIFALVTFLWVRVELRHRALEPLRRLGRVAAGLVVVVLGVPTLVLMPAFWLDSRLPSEVGLTRYLAPLMTLVLISLGLVTLVNIVGGLVVAGRGALVRRRRLTAR
jgi:hypothetical protein